MASRALLLQLLVVMISLAPAWCVHGDGVSGEEHGRGAQGEPKHHGPWMKGPLKEHGHQGMDWSARGGSAGTYANGRGLSCKTYPWVCTVNKNAAGKDCCGSSCVNKRKDVANCGYCGKRCHSPYGACCFGKCVNMLTDNYNCGGCGRKCGMETCQFGICSYDGIY